MKRIIRIADLACGAGMASLGVCRELERLGFQPVVVLACDPWGPAIESYRENLRKYLSVPGALQCKAEDLTGLPTVDLVLSGPPCIRDSTLSKGKGRTDSDGSVAATKSVVEQLGGQARLEVMETVGRSWVSWGKERGFQSVRVKDSDLRGYTIRRRTMLLRGFEAKVPEPPRRDETEATCAGWDEVDGISDRFFNFKGKNGDNTRYVMANDADSEAKRRKHPRPGHLPGYAIVGHGTSHRIYDLGEDGKGWDYVHRLTPEESRSLSGFGPELQLLSTKVRERQTLVGNGWPASYGRWVTGLVAAEVRSW